MVNPVMSPDYELARRLARMETNIMALAARQNPVIPASWGAQQSAFTVTTAGTVRAQASTVVPEGYTTCLVFNGVAAGALNGTGASDYFYVAASINGAAGPETPSIAAAGGYASGSAFSTQTLTGLAAGVTITAEVRVRSGSGAWGSNASNTANSNALFFFFR